MLAGSCSSCGITAFSGTSQLKRQGHASRAGSHLSRKSLMAAISRKRSSRLSVNAIGGGGKLPLKYALSYDMMLFGAHF